MRSGYRIRRYLESVTYQDPAGPVVTLVIVTSKLGISVTVPLADVVPENVTSVSTPPGVTLKLVAAGAPSQGGLVIAQRVDTGQRVPVSDVSNFPGP